MNNERAEDIGKLSILLETVLEEEVFDLLGAFRCKDYAEHFETLSKEQQDDILEKFAYGIRDIKEKLYRCLSIAEGHHDPELE